MRRLVLAVAVLTALVGCGPVPAYVAQGRQGSWRQIRSPAFGAGPSAAIAGLVAPGDGYGSWAAVGSVRDGRTTAVAWSSADGSRWARSDLDGAGGRESEATAGARRQGVVVVVGTVITPAGDRDGRIWTSRDGATWSVAGVPAGGPGDQRITRVAGGPLGFVAGGTDGRRPAVWTSADGAAWTRATGPFQDSQAIEGVAVGAQGAVAVGTLSVSGNVDGMAWFSPDGHAWRVVPLGGAAGFTGPVTQAVHAVTATAGGFVAVGDDANAERRVAASWTSADGTTWQRSAGNDMTVTAGVTTGGVTAVGVAGAGPVVAVGGSSSLQLWTSPDGRRWAPEEPPARLNTSAVVASDGRAVLVSAGAAGLWLRAPTGAWADVGSDGSVFPRAAGTYSLRDLVRIGDQYVAFGYDPNGVALWRSHDGLSWSRREDAESAFKDGQVDGLTAWDGVLVAAGAGPATGPNVSNVAAVWLSDDGGGTWRRIDPGNPAFSVRRTTQIFDIAAGAGGVVAVGLSWDGISMDAQAWHSPDGRIWRRASEPPAWSGPGDQAFTGACALPGGGFVGVAYSVIQGKRQDFAWVSSDGLNWELTRDAHLGNLSCTTAADGVLLTGTVPGDGGDEVVLLRTTDGRTWAGVGPPGVLTTHADDAYAHVAAEGEGMVMAAEIGGDVIVFTSADRGATWRRASIGPLGAMGYQGVWDLEMAGGQVLMVGRDGASGAAWVGPAP